MSAITRVTVGMDQQRWFGTPDRAGPAGRRLFCLPYAGGDATAYRAWPAAMPDTVRVEAVRLPGRDDRLDEPLSLSAGPIAEAIAGRADGPYALYGHSMGARVAFEVVRELRRRGAPPPERLYVGAARPPHAREPLSGLADWAEDRVVEELIRRLNAPPELRDLPTARALIMPLMRTDLDWLKRYRFTAEEPLDVPIVAFAGTDDREVSPIKMLGWARHTRAGFRLSTVRGHHLFGTAPDSPVPALLARDLLAEGAPTGPPAGDEVHVWLDVPPGEVPGRYGSAPGLHFTGAESDGRTVVTVALGRPAGAAIERVRPAADPFGYAGLSESEIAEIAAEPEEARLLTALRFATAGRAVLGAGGGEGVTVMHLPLDGAVAAVALGGGEWRLRFETARVGLR